MTNMTAIAPNLVEAVVLLHPLAGGQVPTPAQSKLTAHRVLQGAIQETGLQPDASAIFENLNSFSIRAEKPLLDAIARAKEVSQVLPNEMPPSGPIASLKHNTDKLAK